jgi:5-methylcytosine-specific restriction endonuclease McrA
MPVMRPCIEPHCPNLTLRTRCPLHEQERKRKPSWKTTRQQVLARDGFACRRCGSNEGLQVDHVDEDRTNDSLENLLTLCTNCHARKHGKKAKTGLPRGVHETRLKRMGRQ